MASCGQYKPSTYVNYVDCILEQTLKPRQSYILFEDISDLFIHKRGKVQSSPALFLQYTVTLSRMALRYIYNPRCG